jgi:Domain of unknown function (DUF6907)
MGRNKGGPGPVQQHRSEASAQVHWRHEHREVSIPEHRFHPVSSPQTLPAPGVHRPGGVADVGLMSTRTYLVRTVQRPVILCPSWCTATEVQHVDELTSLDGSVMHIGDSVPMVADGSFEVHPIAARLVDGTPDPEDPELRVRLAVQRDEAYTLVEAETIAGQLAGFVHRLRHGS